MRAKLAFVQKRNDDDTEMGAPRSVSAPVPATGVVTQVVKGLLSAVGMAFL